MDLSYLESVFQSQGLTHSQSAAIRAAIHNNRKHESPAPTLSIVTIDLDASPTVPANARTPEIVQSISPSYNERYDDLGLLGKGGMGEVRRIRDRVLNRKLAMKIIHARILGRSSVVARFVEEGQVCAQLQHPNIVPVHEMGQLPDGRFYFTMQEIQGRQLTDAIDNVHDAIEYDRWQPTADGWNFRRLIDVFHQVCNAVAYAHSKGVVHRDLKPENIMLGSYGEVLVVDWGIAKVMGRTDLHGKPNTTDVVSTGRSEQGVHATRMGQVAGTPAYMAPEQAKGHIDQIDERTDIYALGAILYEILSGTPPFTGKSGTQVLEKVLNGPPPTLRTPNGPPESEDNTSLAKKQIKIRASKPPLPQDLLGACERAMAREPSARYQNVNDLAEEIEAWLEGAKKREQALKVVKDALQGDNDAAEWKEKASRLREMAKNNLKEIPVWESEETKAPHWALEDEATALDQMVQLLSIEREQKLHAALTHKSDLPEAHAELSSQYRALHEAAEADRNESETKQAALRLLEHANALPIDNTDRESHFNYLKGVGSLSLMTSESDAEVQLEKYLVHNRRLVAKPMKSMGSTPLLSTPLEMGSYRLRIRKEGFHDVLYPVSIGRGERWTGIHPTLESSLPLWLPPNGTLGNDDCYVPAGWFWSGGDSKVATSLPKQRIWLDDFVIRRFPVTNREYIEFLNDLVRCDLETLALQHVPRDRSGQAGQSGAMIYGRNETGQFVLVPDADGDLWRLDWPVCMVDWHGAVAFADWKAKKEGVAWRLPEEFEWEKSARGVDGRFFPWGDRFDPSWCCVGHSHKGRMLPAVVNGYPVDESPYGVRGLAGNMRDWTATAHHKNGPVVTNGLVENRERTIQEKDHRVLRGGGWNGFSWYAHASNRLSNLPSTRYDFIGFRLARSLP